MGSSGRGNESPNRSAIDTPIAVEGVLVIRLTLRAAGPVSEYTTAACSRLVCDG